MSEAARRWTISGRVQGVGYRMFVFRAGARAGLRGYVRNMPDGTVEAAAAGAKADLDQLETLLKRGPEASRVDSVRSLDAPSAEDLPLPFQIWR